MSEEKLERLNKVVRELNISLGRAVDFLNSKGYSIRNDPNGKINEDQYKILLKEFGSDLKDKKEASELNFGRKPAATEYKHTSPNTEERLERPVEPVSKAVEPVLNPSHDTVVRTEVKMEGPKVLGKIELTPKKFADRDKPATPAPSATSVEKMELPKAPEIQHTEAPTTSKAPLEPTEPSTVTASEPATANAGSPIVVPEEPLSSALIEGKADSLKGLTVLGKIELQPERPKSAPEKKDDFRRDDKKKRKRIKIEPKPAQIFQNKDNQGKRDDRRRDTPGAAPKDEITAKDIQEQIKNTLARMSGGSNAKNQPSRAKYRKEKRSAAAEAHEERMLQEEADSKILKVTEFISANDLASLMSVTVNEVIAACLSLGLFVSINQRLDAETIQIIADEFGYQAKFVTAEEEITVEEDEDTPDELISRPPIVTIMGHVDHGKTSLLDYIRKTNVTAKEAGGITQHIGAYDVKTESGKWITFLDTPGHEAFTAMRARGAKVTDIVIIVVAADDGVKPQTKEALNHALIAGVPIVIAINKIDKPGANLERVKEQLANENILVEDWGGKYQCEGVSAKSGLGIKELLEKVLLEAELLDLKANPHKNAVGTVIEATLDKGRGYVTTVLIQSGTMRQGDIMLAGQFYGRVRAMIDHKGNRLKEAGPSKPVQILGLSAAPQAGDKVNVLDSEQEAREIANKREQIIREQSIRTKKHITLDEIGRRLAIGNFKQLNLIVKGDVDGSIEALSDSLLKLSTEEIQVSIIHKGVGQISESDVLLASASDAIIVGFQVRPSMSARKLAEAEEIEIRLYSIIYDTINDIKDAMLGMLEPKMEEIIVGMAEVREVFKITKVGTVAGCMVIEGSIKRANEVRIIREGIVIYSGKLSSLKRFKDDSSEVKTGQDCGIGIDGFNDIMVGDIFESFEKREVKRSL